MEAARQRQRDSVLRRRPQGPGWRRWAAAAIRAKAVIWVSQKGCGRAAAASLHLVEAAEAREDHCLPYAERVGGGGPGVVDAARGGAGQGRSAVSTPERSGIQQSQCGVRPAWWC